MPSWYRHFLLFIFFPRWNTVICRFWSPPQAKSTLGLDFDLQDINLILRVLPREELEVKKSRQVKVLRGLHLVRSPLVLQDRASSTEAATVGLTLNISPKAGDSPGLSSPALLSLLWVRILSLSPVTVSVLKGCGRRRDESLERERGDGQPMGEKERWTEEYCWEAEGGGSSRKDFSSSSCLRKRLFSLLRAFNWEKREREMHKEDGGWHYLRHKAFAAVK